MPGETEHNLMGVSMTETPDVGLTDELAAYQAGQVAEWGVYVARGPIDIEGARAFNAGDPVPVSHVVRGVVTLDLVRRVDEQAPVPVAVAVHVPVGADIEPDRADQDAADAANAAAGVE
jgi:hypothetical protein